MQIFYCFKHVVLKLYFLTTLDVTQTCTHISLSKTPACTSLPIDKPFFCTIMPLCTFPWSFTAGLSPTCLRPVPSTLRASRRARGFPALLNCHGQRQRAKVGITRDCLLSEALRNLQPALQTDTLTAAIDAVVNTTALGEQCQTLPLLCPLCNECYDLILLSLQKREVHLWHQRQQTAAVGPVNPHLLHFFHNKNMQFLACLQTQTM